MIIGIDIRPLQMHHRFRGIGMHMVNLINRLSDMMGSDDKLIFFIDGKLEDPLKYLSISSSCKYNVITLNRDIKGISKAISNFSSLKFINELRSVVKKPLPSKQIGRCDVFLGFDFMLGIPGSYKQKYIIIGYDLIPLIYRDYYLPSYNKNKKIVGRRKAATDHYVYILYRWASKKASLRAARIIAISRATKKQFEYLIPESIGKIDVVYLGAPERVTNNEHISQNIAELLNEKYIFYIGGGDARRKIDHLIWAYNNLKKEHPKLKLVLAGNDFRDIEAIPSEEIKVAIKKSPYLSDIALLGFINDKERQFLYKRAVAFVYPTLSEGFGLPILEAFQENCPTISYDNEFSSVKEISGNGAIIGRPNKEFILSSLRKILNEIDTQDQLTKRAKEQLRKYSWDNNARETLKIIKKVASES